MLVKDVVQKTAAFFKEKGIESSRLDAELLISSALNWERIQIYLKFDYPMSEVELSACREFVRRRGQGEPVAYILGQKDFYDSSFLVGPGVLVPRPETEGLVERALEFAKSREAGVPFRVVDFGSGSGCVGLSILKAIPAARLLAVDASPIAIEMTKKNADRLGLADRCEALCAGVEILTREQVEGAVGGPVDMVVANPPYVAETDPSLAPDVRRHEPALALFSGDDGFAHIREWAAKASGILSPNGRAIFEIGTGQGARTREIFDAVGGFRAAAIEKDLAGHERYARADRNGEG